MTKEEVATFKKHFHELHQKALHHLISKEWIDLIDRDVRIQMPIINDREVHFELIHMMVNKILATKVMTWEQINEIME